jgi:uncharacterized membrane protein
MISGFVGTMVPMMFHGSVISLTSSSVVPFYAYAHPTQIPAGLLAMSAGILFLVSLPAMRVLLALVTYVRQKGFINAAIALLVLLELLIGLRAG